MSASAGTTINVDDDKASGSFKISVRVGTSISPTTASKIINDKASGGPRIKERLAQSPDTKLTIDSFASKPQAVPTTQ